MVDGELSTKDRWKIPTTPTRWKDALNIIYTGDTHSYYSAKGLLSTYSPELRELLDVETEEMTLIENFLRRHGLLSSASPNSMELSSKGFDVALQNEKIENDEKNRDRMFCATCVIAAAAVMGLFVAVGIDVIIVIINELITEIR